MSNRTKVAYLRDLATSSSCSMIVLTETHLSPSVQDAEVAIAGYNLYRADREERTHGGCAVYVREELTSSLVAAHSNSVCETLVVRVRPLDTLLVCQYRPPNCKFDDFSEALSVAQDAIDATMKEESKVRTILTFGDFNFPFISWPSRQVYCDNRQGRETQSDQKRQAELFKSFCDDNFLENFIETPTRGENILDLVLSNNHTLIKYYKTVVNKKLSDHSTIKINLNFTFNTETKDEKVLNPYSTKIYEYETNKATDKEWTRFDYVLQNINAEELLHDKEPEEQLSRIIKTLEEAADLCLRKKEAFLKENIDENGPLKKRKFIPKQIRRLIRRKEKLSDRMTKSRCWQKNYKVYKELEEIETEIEDSYKRIRKKEETVLLRS